MLRRPILPRLLVRRLLLRAAHRRRRRDSHRTGLERDAARAEHRLDGFRAEQPTVTYAICAIPRSGSGLLSTGLRDSNLAGRPMEFFNDHIYPSILAHWGCMSRAARSLSWLTPFVSLFRLSPSTLRTYVAELPRRRSSDNGVFGFKVHYMQWEAELAPRPFHTLFPRLRYIAIRRQDRVRQAVSFVRALQSDRWRAPQDEILPPKYSSGAIASALANIERQEAGWERYFETHGIEPLRIVYESLATSYEETLLEVLDFLGVERPPGLRLPPPRSQRLADTLTEEWVARFRAEEGVSLQR